MATESKIRVELCFLSLFTAQESGLAVGIFNGCQSIPIPRALALASTMSYAPSKLPEQHSLLQPAANEFYCMKNTLVDA